MAKCPNCETQILWDARECVQCTASFGETSAWRPIAQSAREEQLIEERRLAYAASAAAASVMPSPRGERGISEVLVATDVRREWRFSVRRLSAGLIALALSACTTTQQAYPGAPQPDEATAVITTKYAETGPIPIYVGYPPLFFSYVWRTCIYTVDGQPLGSAQWRQEARILSGTRTVEVAYFSGVSPGEVGNCSQQSKSSIFSKFATLTFMAKAGGRYFVNGTAKNTGHKACRSVWIEEVDTHEVVATDGETCE